MSFDNIFKNNNQKKPKFRRLTPIIKIPIYISYQTYCFILPPLPKTTKTTFSVIFVLEYIFNEARNYFTKNV